MRVQKFNHMPGGKVFGVIFVVLGIALVGLSILLIMAKNIDILSVLVLLVSVVCVIWFAYKFYKPGFTEIIFSEDGIVSKTPFEEERLSLDDIKGIWYYVNRQTSEHEILPYSEDTVLKSNCVVIIGDLDYFSGVEYVGMNGMMILHDSFKKGYTTLCYRKKLGAILNYYRDKIQAE